MEPDPDDFRPPEWWKPWSEYPDLLTATRATVERLGDEPFMTWLDDKGREELTLSFNDVWNQSAAIAVLMSRECVCLCAPGRVWLMLWRILPRATPHARVLPGTRGCRVARRPSRGSAQRETF